MYEYVCTVSSKYMTSVDTTDLNEVWWCINAWMIWEIIGYGTGLPPAWHQPMSIIEKDH